MRRQVLYALAVSVLASGAPWTVQELSADEKSVKVAVTCPSAGSGKLTFEVEPWEVVVDGATDDSILWDLNITGSSDDTIEIDKKKSGKWPYKKDKLSGKKTVRNKDWKDKAKRSYSYNITVHCDGDAVVLDPRVKVN